MARPTTDCPTCARCGPDHGGRCVVRITHAGLSPAFQRDLDALLANLDDGESLADSISGGPLYRLYRECCAPDPMVDSPTTFLAWLIRFLGEMSAVDALRPGENPLTVGP